MESYQHNQLKLAVAHAIHGRIRGRRLGVFFTDGMVLCLPLREGRCIPDGFFVTFRQLRRTCRLQHGAGGGITAVRGVPKLIVEIASPGRLRADIDDKLHDYERNRVKEFWLFCPAGLTYDFELLTLDRTGRYYRQRPFGRGGYSRSLRCSCRLHCLPSEDGLPHYELAFTDTGKPEVTVYTPMPRAAFSASIPEPRVMKT